MSQIINKVVSKISGAARRDKHYKPDESISSKRAGRNVGDSARTVQGSCMTNNIAAGTFSGVIGSARSAAALSLLLGAMGVLALPVFVAQNVSAADSITVTIDGQTSKTIALDISARHANGTFSKSATSTISVKTTNSTGYTLGIRATGSNPTELVNGSDNTKKLTSITSPTTEEQFKALTDDNKLNGKWGYLPSKYCTGEAATSCEANTAFLPAPDTTGDTLDITSTANSEAKTYELAIGARVDSSQKMGSYTNTYVVYADANAIPYSITYDDNVVGNMPADVNSGQATGGNFALANNVPTRDGYTFLGWCTVQPTNNNGTDTCSGTQYAAGASITISAATNFHLYAMWGEVKNISNATYMQEVGACPSTLTTGQNYTLKDSRDNQDYTVAKLADGKCWMTKNLNIAGGTALTSDKTDFDSSYTIPTTQGWQSGGKLPASSTSGFSNANYAYVYNSNSTNCGNNSPCYSYYSWDAATLGSGRSITADNTDAPYSICPKGWKLPTSRTTSAANWQTESDFYNLAVAYGMNSGSTSQSSGTFYNNAGPNTSVPNFLLAGYYYGGSFANGGSYGYYWSATSVSSTYARLLYFYSSYVYSASGSSRYDGFSVRCVLAE